MLSPAGEVVSAPRGYLAAQVLLAESAAAHIKPPPRLSVSEWADRYRVIPEGNAKPGPWRTSVVPYTREWMDCASDPRIHELVLKCSAQVAKTEALMNILMYFIDYDPSFIAWMMPTLHAAEKWSKERFTASTKESPALRGKISEVRDTRKGITSTILDKIFPGGSLSIHGANSPTDLSSQPRRVSLCDEVNRYEVSAGQEGNPVELLRTRSETFWNWFHAQASTPTEKGASAIDTEYERGDQRVYLVPCPECKELQELVWDRFTWEGKGGNDPEAEKPETVCYACIHCAAAIYERSKRWMLDPVNGAHWKPTAPGRKRRSYFIWSAYSPFKAWPALIEDWMRMRAHPQDRRVFWNTRLGLAYEDDFEGLSAEGLAKRAEYFDGRLETEAPRFDLPKNATILTFGADVQGDRIECEVVAWGPLEESWSVEYRIFNGDTSQPDVWARFDKFLLTATYRHELGMEMSLASGIIDAGYRFIEVLRFVRGKEHRWVFADKGISGWGRPPVQRSKTKTKAKTYLYLTAVDVVKQRIYALLGQKAGEAGYCHFPVGYPDSFYKQMVSEKLVKKFVKGRPKMEWVLPRGERNEVLDCRVRAYSALANLAKDPISWLDREHRKLLKEAQSLAADTDQAVEAKPEPAEPPPPPEQKRRVVKVSKKGGWL